VTDRIKLDDLTSDQLDALYERLEQAEYTARCYAEADSANAAAGSYAGRAEQAEAAITRVRAALPPYDMPILGDRSRGVQMGWDRARQAVLDALVEPASGPAATRTTDGTVCAAYQPPTKPEDSGLCARCGMADWKHKETPGA
jgi:hypothetical protein